MVRHLQVLAWMSDMEGATVHATFVSTRSMMVANVDRPGRHLLAAIVAAVIPAQVGVAEYIAIDGEWANVGIVTRCVMVRACPAGLEWDPVDSVSSTFVSTDGKTIPFCQLNQWGDLHYWRGWWGRRRVIMIASH